MQRERRHPTRAWFSGPRANLGALMVLAASPACTQRQEAPAPPTQSTTARGDDPQGLDPKTLGQSQAIANAVAKASAAGPVATTTDNIAPKGGESAAASAGSASASASASASVFPSASASALASASASAMAASPSALAAAAGSGSVSGASDASDASGAGLPTPSRDVLLARMIGAWGFSRFDLDDPGTKARWTAVPGDVQKEILKTAPEAWLFIGKDTMITRLDGVPEKKSTYTVEAESAAFPPGTILAKTNDEGRKAIRFLDADTMRVEDLDKKASFVTIFTRKKSK